MNDNPTDANEQYELGKKYYWGEGVPEDKEKAVYWYTKAAEQGHFDACCSLRSCYLTTDPVKAEYWHERSMQAGTMNYSRKGTVLDEYNPRDGSDISIGEGCNSGCFTGIIIGIILGIIMFIICLVDGNGGNGIVAIIFLTIFGAIGGSVIGAIINFFRKLFG